MWVGQGDTLPTPRFHLRCGGAVRSPPGDTFYTHKRRHPRVCGSLIDYPATFYGWRSADSRIATHQAAA